MHAKLHDAYTTLYDQHRRQNYDSQHNLPNRRQGGTEGPHAERAGAWPSHCPETPEMRKHRQRQEELAAQLLELQKQKACAEDDLDGIMVNLGHKRAVLLRLQEEETKYKNDKASWWNFLWRKTAEEEEVSNREATARRTGILVVKAQLDQIRSEITSKSERLENIKSKIQQAVRQKASANYDYEYARERERMAKAEQESQKRQQAAQQAAANRRKDEATRAAAADKARRQREEAAKAAEDRQRQDEALNKARQKHQQTRAQTGGYTNQSQPGHPSQPYNMQPDNNPGGQPGLCHHRAFWAKISGTGICQRCNRRVPWFLFQCPGCRMQACADCRTILKRPVSRYS